MLSTARSRAALLLSRQAQQSSKRAFTISTTPRREAPLQDDVQNVSKTNETAVEGGHLGAVQESVQDAEVARTTQAPNRVGIWSRSQNPREKAMTGPRFEQTIMEMQPQPQAAIALIHAQPVRWTKDRSVACDGGGGPLGHPRIFINVDKPQICPCEYCGLPYANEGHRKHLESLPSTSYPLDPVQQAAEVAS